MEWLGKQKDTIFLGQTVKYKGSPMFKTLEKVKDKKIEMPVFEDCQMGISIGLALEGFVPISIFPRMDFLICATNQLVNHLDKIKEMTGNEFQAGVIIRTQIGNTKPLYPGPQHCGDYGLGIDILTENIDLVYLDDKKEIIKKYKRAYKDAKKGISTILVETPQGGKDPNIYK
jgi:hypothetical protein